jgi:uncharacterized protein YbjQ (UPF0145 family)
MASVCTRCNAKLGMLTTALSMGEQAVYCDKCGRIVEREEEAQYAKSQEAKKQRLIELKQLSKKVIVTTTPGIDGYRIKEYLGIESVEFVIGTGVFSEISSSMADFFGARSSVFEQKLRQAKQHAMESLKFIAAEKGASAVVAVDLDYTEFSGNRIALIINGTLVNIEPVVNV